jgi:ATP-dependent RNA helicase RhlE
MKTFSDFALSPLLKSNLEKNGFSTPTPVQAQVIEPALDGRDIVATAQTGTGKTLAFVLPILQKLAGQRAAGPGIRAVILSPTRELALQIDETFVAMAAGSGVRTAVVVGGLSEHKQLQAIRKGAHVIIATPGRLYDYIQRRLVDLRGVHTFVLDEADRMLGMGFLPSITRIMAATPKARQTMFFSATIETAVKHLVSDHVRDAVRIEIGSTTKPAEEVDLHFYEVEQDRKIDLLHSLLKRNEGSFLVFARTKRGADRLANRLAGDGVRAGAIHGDRSQIQRNQALRQFQEGHVRVLVATDVAARGIHVDGISQVVNYDLPQVPEDFIHRVGRTGRAGRRGTATTFGTRAERGTVAHIERALSVRLTRYLENGEVSQDQTSASGKPEKRVWRSFGGSRGGRRSARR